MFATSLGFHRRSMYRVKRRGAVIHYAKQKLSFVIALLSVFAFIVGNVVGRAGWYGFTKAVFGHDVDSTIVFTGTVPPTVAIDYKLWSQYGGDKRLHAYTQVPKNAIRQLPEYDPIMLASADTTFAHQVYTTLWGGGYNKPQGSHGGVDIDTVKGAPVYSIANGVIEKAVQQSVGLGNHIVVRHPNTPDMRNPGQFTTVYSTYSHLDAILVTEGEVVQKGQQIGTVGNTGLVMGATGYHLLFNIDTAEAPFHPYWPFTPADAKAAGLTFMQAVDSTKFRDRLQQYTLNPMLFVQQYASYAGTTRVASAEQPKTESAIAKLSPKERTEYRRAQRMKVLTARLETEPVRVAAVTPAPVTEILSSASSSMSSVSSSVASSSAAPIISSSASSIQSEPSTPLLASTQPTTVVAPVYTAAATEVHHLRIEHNGTFGRSWQKVTIVAENANGETISSPSFNGRLFLVPTFGDALIRPTNEITPLDFVNGQATLHILPKDGVKTLIFETKSNIPALQAVSAPMVYGK
jgi:murein DD-endopeptidase MepM/ murein hydrolase activator NlpD